MIITNNTMDVDSKYYGNVKVHFVVVNNEWDGEDFNGKAIMACFPDYSKYCIFAWPSHYDPETGEHILASDGCFWGDARFGDENRILEALILAGNLKVTGRFYSDGGNYQFAELRPNEEWLETIYELKRFDDPETDNRIVATVDDNIREAKFIRSDFRWSICEINPRFSPRTNNRCYRITVTSLKDECMSVTTSDHQTIVDAWFEALKYEKALKELVEVGQRAAKIIGVPLCDLLGNIASHNWYLEG